jgi:hypothetical protein
MLRTNFINTLFNTAGNLAVEKGLDKDLILNELQACNTQESLVDIVRKRFGDDIIIREYIGPEI